MMMVEHLVTEYDGGMKSKEKMSMKEFKPRSVHSISMVFILKIGRDIVRKIYED